MVTGSDGVDNYGSQITGFERWIMWGGGVADQVQLGAGRDKFKGFGGDDSALGMAGADRLNGSAGNDVLSGGEGGDHMIGGPGIDRLTGGLGADVFAFGRLERAGVLITDFTSGGDRIAIASAALVGALPLGAVDEAHFHPDFALGPDGQFGYRASSTAGRTELIWDSNGAEAGKEFLVALFSGGPTMAATDIDILA